MSEMKQNLRDMVDDTFREIKQNLEKYQANPDKAVLKQMFEDVDWIQKTSEKFGETAIYNRAEAVYDGIMEAASAAKAANGPANPASQIETGRVSRQAIGDGAQVVVNGIAEPKSVASTFLSRFAHGVSESLQSNLPEAMAENLEKFRATGDLHYAKNVNQMIKMAVATNDKNIMGQVEKYADGFIDTVRAHAEKEGGNPGAYAEKHGLDAVATTLKQEDARLSSASDVESMSAKDGNGKYNVKNASNCSVGTGAKLSF